MIIDKIDPFWTKEDTKKILTAYKENGYIVTEAKPESPFNRPNLVSLNWKSDGTISLSEAIENVMRANFEAEEEVVNRYVKSFKKNPEGILEDIKDIIDHIEEEDIQAEISQKNIKIKIKKGLREAGTPEDPEALTLEELEAIDDYTTAYNTVLDSINYQLYALDIYGLDTTYSDIIEALIKEKLSLWYTPKEPFIIPKPQGKIVSYKHPTKHLQNLTRANTRIFSLPLQELASTKIDITPHNYKKENVFVLVDLTLDENLQGLEQLEDIDKSVQNAIYSLTIANPNNPTNFFTAKQVATHILYGDNPSNSNPPQSKIDECTESIERQRHIDLKIDYTQHAKLNKNLPEGIEELTVKNYMIPLKESDATINGVKLKGYILLDIPPLFEYASYTGQIATHPANLLNVPVNLDNKKLALRDFLLEEIGHISKNKNWNTTITIDRILEKAGYNLSSLSRTQRSRLITVIKTMLDYWQIKGAIKGYKENYTGKRLTSITIHPNTPQQLV